MAVISGNKGFVVIGTIANVEGITKAAECQITSTAHPFVDGDLIFIRGLVGMTQITLKVFMVADKADDTFKILDKDLLTHIDSTLYTSWSAEGTIQKAIPITEWSLENKAEVSDVTDSTSSVYKDWVAVGFTQSSGKMKGWFRQGEVLPANHTELDAVFYLIPTEVHDDADIYYSGKIILTSILHSLKIDSTDAVTVEYTWSSGAGGLSYTNNT